MIEQKTILLAEDNARDAELTLEAINENNISDRIILVKDGNEAMEYLTYKGNHENRKRELPVLTILDLKMPRMNGLEVLAAIRNDPSLSHLPVVILTSSCEESDLAKSYSLGVNAFVVKPIDYTDFSFTIKQLGIFWILINELPKQ